jgi:hypothetical protein
MPKQTINNLILQVKLIENNQSSYMTDYMAYIKKHFLSAIINSKMGVISFVATIKTYPSTG